MGEPRYRALLIGNSTFPADAHNLQTLEGPVNDVTFLRAALSDPGSGMFEPDNVRVVPERTTPEVLGELEQFLGGAGRDDTLLLYYSGHGLLNESGQLFLCARDTRTDRLLSTAVSSTTVNQMIDASAARSTVIVLDCCHSGAFKGGSVPASLRGTGRFVIASSRSGQLANDADRLNRTSLFTQHLVEGLTTDAPDVDGDGYVDLSDLFDYVSERLREEGRQTPQRDFSGDGDIAIARRAAAATKGSTGPLAGAGPMAGTGLGTGLSAGLDPGLDFELDFGTLEVSQDSPSLRARVPPALAIVAVDPWIEAVQQGDAVVVRVDTSSPGRLSGDVRLEGGGARGRIAVRAVVVAPVGALPSTAVPSTAVPSSDGATSAVTGTGRRQIPRWAIPAGAGAVAAILVGVLLGTLLGEGGSPGSSPPGRGQLITVAANVLWTDTGLDLRADEPFNISGSGVIDTATDLAGRDATPNGIPGELNHPNNLVAGVEHGALIGRIGDGTPFKVGNFVGFEGHPPGRLYLGVNDKGVENNRGSFTAEVNI